MIPEPNLLTTILKGLSTKSVHDNKSLPPVELRLFPNYSIHTSLSFLSDYKHFKDRCHDIKTAQHSASHCVDSFPSSRCVPIVSISVTKWFHIQKQKLMDLSEGRTDPCTLTQKIKEDHSFSNILIDELGIGKCRIRAIHCIVAGLEPQAQPQCQPDNKNNNPHFSSP